MADRSSLVTDAGRLFGRSMAFPPRIGADGRVAWSEGEANIRESIQIILKTELQERINAPSFGAGLNAFLFEPNTVATRQRIAEQIREALRLWEPRVLVLGVDVEQDPDAAETAIATVQYRLIATGHRELVTVQVQLAGQR